jgi:hypothetical protein
VVQRGPQALFGLDGWTGRCERRGRFGCCSTVLVHGVSLTTGVGSSTMTPITYPVQSKYLRATIGFLDV